MSIIMDFLSKRYFVVEVAGENSNIKSLELGCVQGSILGPKLFNLYMKDVCNNVNEKHITTYADDSYVLIKGQMEDLQNEVKTTITQHLRYLNKMGMVTNLSKTEAAVFSHGLKEELTIDIGGEKFRTGKEMKVLGITFDDKLSWNPHVEKVIGKAKKLNSALSFIRKNLQKTSS